METSTIVLIIILQLVASQSDSGVVEICEERPKYSFNILDAVVVDTVEFFLESTCNRTVSDAFDSVFWCFSEILNLPQLQLAWTYRSHQPRIIGLKNYFCLYILEAGKCHDFQTGVSFFSCPNGYTEKILQLADILVGKTYEYFCSGDGIPMISLVSSHGDACFQDGRESLMDCMYHTHPTLRQISVEQLKYPKARQPVPLVPFCNSLQVIRHCAYKTFSKCSTAIPVNVLDQFLEEFGNSINCVDKTIALDETDTHSRRILHNSNRRLFNFA